MAVPSLFDQDPTKKGTAIRFGFLPLAFLIILIAAILFSKSTLEPTTILYTDPDLLSSQDPALMRIGMRILPSPSPFSEGLEILRSNLGSDVPSDGEKEAAVNEEVDGKCNLYSGNWVRDEASGPPLYYSPETCPYVEEAYQCTRNGRTDDEYLKWRWKPHGCDLPRLNGTRFLEIIRGKKLMLVGDSMNRNQYESLLCMLYQSLPDKTRMYEIGGHNITKGRGYFSFYFADYNCTVDYCRSHFLVREGKRVDRRGRPIPILKIDRIGKSWKKWRRADILVFNTGHWWAHGKTARGKNYYQVGNFTHPRFDAAKAFKMAMRTWARWVDRNMDARKHMVFYRGYSAAHFRGGDWDSGGSCQGEREPILTGPILDNYPSKMKVVEDVIRGMQFPVVFLNVTRSTNHRKDGHPSIFGKKRKKNGKVSGKNQDCSHWCLPGVPDSWNEFIYVNLQRRTL